MWSSSRAHSENYGGLRHATDVRKLNLWIQRHPCPLSDAKDALYEMEGLACAAYVIASMGYYHALLDKNSQDIFSTMLPWGEYFCVHLPQGLSFSPDVFQKKWTVFSLVWNASSFM